MTSSTHCIFLNTDCRLPNVREPNKSCIYVNALREPSCHQSGSTSVCIGIFYLLYISLYSRQGPSSSARYKRCVEGRPVCTILCTLAKEAQVWGQSTAVSSIGFLLRSLGSLRCRILATEPREGILLLATETKNDGRVPKRRCQGFGASGVAAYIVAAWLAAGGDSGKKEVCKGRETRLKLTDARHPSEA